ncbi:MAG: HPr family phosphocarrier protein [Deltaproteobacteria bacterium]|nr:HPr family phosphocarrier protein [Deltaproteobacteria bacterium]
MPEKFQKQNLCDLSFMGRVSFYSHNYLRCMRYITSFESPGNSFTKSLFSKLAMTSHLLEDFLDFHGAKNNSDWYFYREMAAAVRHLSRAGYTQKHISNRLVRYDIDNKRSFRKHGELVLEFVTSSLKNLAVAIIAEARRLEINIPDDGYSESSFPGVTAGEILKPDIDDEDKVQARDHVVRVANEFITIVDEFKTLGFYENGDGGAKENFAPDRVNEVKIRRFEMLVHNLQSSFDTYVIQGGFGHGNPQLKKFRSYFSVIFHLLQIMGRFLHFYERHCIDVGYKNIYRNARNRICQLIPPDELLDCTMDYGLYYVNYYFATGRKIARRILKENIERKSIRVPVPVELGFHTRPSLMVAKIVQKHGGHVDLVVGKDRFDASSVLDIQYAGGKIQKDGIQEVVFEGDARALRDIDILAGVNYGENQIGKGIELPKSIQYLRQSRTI